MRPSGGKAYFELATPPDCDIACREQALDLND
jgi:hypothetical protein